MQNQYTEEENKLIELFYNTSIISEIWNSQINLIGKGYKEGMICSEKLEDKWIIYTTERAKKYNEKTFTNILDAELYILEEFACTKEDANLFKIEFLKNVVNNLVDDNIKLKNKVK